MKTLAEIRDALTARYSGPTKEKNGFTYSMDNGNYSHQAAAAHSLLPSSLPFAHD